MASPGFPPVSARDQQFQKAGSMSIDRILSRFNIQTKVLIFILPFVVSITAVGISGLYASGLLQGRIEISNSVLQSLSGFKDVSVAMGRFLENTTPEHRDDVARQLKQQKLAIDATLSTLDSKAEGRDVLINASKSIDGVVQHIDGLWTLYQTESTTRADIYKNLDIVVEQQKLIKAAAEKVRSDVRADEIGANQMLEDADAITVNAAILIDAGKKFSRLNSPEEKFDFAVKAVVEFAKVRNTLQNILPASNKSMLRSMDNSISALKQLLASNDKSPEMVGNISSKLGSVRQISVYLGLASAQKMKDASIKFAAIKAPIAKADHISASSLQVTDDAYVTQIELAKFMLKPLQDNRTTLSKQIAQLNGDIKTLLGDVGNLPSFSGVSKFMTPAVAEIDQKSLDLVNVTQQRTVDFASAGEDINKIWKELTTFAQLQKESAGVERKSANTISIGATALGVVIAIFAGIGLVMTFKGPIGQITSAMRRLAEGVLDIAINGENRIDEIGEMARALGVFKQNALSKIEIEQRSDAERAAAEAERLRNDAEKIDVDRQIDFAVNALAGGLGRLAQGDISQMIETPFFGRLEQLRNDFNGSLVRLQDTLSQIRNNAEMIQMNANEMSESADELSKRTEQQAASLEQTAAAVEEITVTVKSSAERAQEANDIVADTKRSADASAQVVSNAISAMGRIEEASNKIVQIIDVIDEIAFQTNLLALNAGIEAARAGDAGKGFAVVAMEVRELAQRSASAAKEIKGLIDTSSNEVASGSRLVQQTGKVLAEISVKIVTVSERVEMIASASRDQSVGLAEVNTSVNQMDHMTQKNAAMVEETNAATRQLANEADTLMMLVEQFKLSKAARSTVRALEHAA
jgi:methyl-accepting chemotaxis protein